MRAPQMRFTRNEALQRCDIRPRPSGVELAQRGRMSVSALRDSRVEVKAAVCFLLKDSLQTGVASIKVPLSRLPANLATAVSVQVGAPWNDGACAVKVKGGFLSVSLANASLAPFQSSKVPLQLRLANGRTVQLRVEASSLTADRSQLELRELENK